MVPSLRSPSWTSAVSFDFELGMTFKSAAPKQRRKCAWSLRISVLSIGLLLIRARRAPRPEACHEMAGRGKREGEGRRWIPGGRLRGVNERSAMHERPWGPGWNPDIQLIGGQSDTLRTAPRSRTRAELTSILESSRAP